MSSESSIYAPHREQLLLLLQEAAEIEHNLMCCYLYAMFSLKQREDEGLERRELEAVRRWRGVILSVALEEMSHLTLVGNLMAALGSAPYFGRPNFPIAPGYHPADVVMRLDRFDLATLDHFIYLERPDGIALDDGAGYTHTYRYERAPVCGRLMPSSQDYETVGQLYRGIADSLRSLAQQHGSDKLFVGRPEAQIGPELVNLQGIMRVHDLDSALQAIETIIRQGEGSLEEHHDSHYCRFLRLRDEYLALQQARPAFEPARPVARNPVMRKPPFPEDRVHISEPTAARLIDLANALYIHSMRLLAHSYNRPDAGQNGAQRAVVDAAIALMHLLTPVAEVLTEMPAQPDLPGVTAGMSFATLRAIVPAAGGAAEIQLLCERLLELSEAATTLAEVHPQLKQLGGQLAQLANRLGSQLEAARAASETARQPEAPAAEVAPAPPASPAVAPQIEVAAGENMTIHFEAKRCIHARFCVLGLPKVFKANVPGAWIDPDASSVESLLSVAHNCPSGAIRYARHDGGPEESAPEINLVQIRENGPLAIRAHLSIDEEFVGFRATLCRCGASQNKPFCDGSHNAAGFAASGEPATLESQPLAVRSGPLSVRPERNGPLAVTGNLEILAGTGRTITRLDQARLCRCGASQNKPFCDGSHARVGFNSGD